MGQLQLQVTSYKLQVTVSVTDGIDIAILATYGFEGAEEALPQLTASSPGFVGNRLLVAKDVSTCDGRLT